MKFREWHKESAPEHALSATRTSLYEEAPAFKEYKRFPRTPLPAPERIEEPLSSLLQKRTTQRDHDPKKMLSLQALSDVLFAGAGINRSRVGNDMPPNPRFHPSGGGLYPLEYYLAARRIDPLSPALYHYAPQEHALEEVVTGNAELVHMSSIGMIPPQDPAAIIVITASWGRNYARYGEFAYRLALIETGHSAHDMLLAATARELSAASMGGFKAKEMSQALDLVEDDLEDPLYLIYLGA